MPDSDHEAPISSADRHLADDERLELLDLLLEAAMDGYLDWRLADGNVYFSSRFRMILGYDDASLDPTARAWLELIHPEDQSMVEAALADLIAGVWPFDLTFRLKHRQSGWKWVRGRGAVHRTTCGTAIRIVATFSDVTAQVRAERRQMSLFNAVPDLLIRLQSDFTVLDLKIPESSGAYALDAPRPGERMNHSPFTNGWWEQAAQAITLSLRDHSAMRFEARHQVGTGNTDVYDLEVRVFPSADDELLLVIRDITAEKQQREQGLQSQKLEAIGQLAAGIAHEINTPLQFVGDNLHFLKEAADALSRANESYKSLIPADASATLETIDSDLDLGYMLEHLDSAFSSAIDGVERVATIVQAMKAFTHPGGKGKQPENLNLALDTTLTLSTNVWKYVAEIERAYAVDLPMVECAIGEINQVLLNLITNAAHAIGDAVGESGTKGRIRVATQRDGDVVEIRIADTGAGIPEAIRPHIFEPFFTTKAVGKGTGQGLPLSRAIVLQHQGSLEFETQLGRGTTFVIRLPVTSTTGASTSR